MRPGALGCLLLCACGVPPPSATAHARQAVLVGAADTHDTHVFLLELRFDNGVNSVCSAVLISPRVLLTAAHCLDPAHQGATAVAVRAMNEPDTSNLASTDFLDVMETTLHPQWDVLATQSDFDLGLALLASAPAQVTAAPLLAVPPATWPGQTLRAVGYGRTSATATDTGTRREALVTVNQENAAAFELGVAGASGICAGDSGGPSFLRGSDGVERVAGIHSSSLSADCGLGVDIRVDSNLAAFINPWVATKDLPLCTADGRCATGCTTVDLDCVCGADGSCALCPNPLLDPDCPHDCGADGVCSAGPCSAPDPDCACAADAVCQVSCGAGRVDPDCPDCGADGVCSAVACPADDVDCGIDGDPCTAASGCLRHLCAQDPRGFKVCSRTCAVDGDCIRGMGCVAGVCAAVLSPAGPVSGGCSQAPGLGLLALALGLRRRRGARARR